MSVKDVKNYYLEIEQQYLDLLNEIHDFEAECEKGLIAPERLDEIKKSIQPLMNNYQTLSYIMFLLNKPVKKETQDKYLKKKQDFLSKIDKKFTKDGLVNQNKEVINNVKNIVKES